MESLERRFDTDGAAVFPFEHLTEPAMRATFAGSDRPIANVALAGRMLEGDGCLKATERAKPGQEKRSKPIEPGTISSDVDTPAADG